MQRENFENLVKRAINSLPSHIQIKMDNVAVVVEERPSKDVLKQAGIRIANSLLGFYQGVPKTVWGRGFGQLLPDKITIFQESIERLASSPQEIEELIKIVVWHEIGHHFGFNEKEIRRLEEKWRRRLNQKVENPKNIKT